MRYLIDNNLPPGLAAALSALDGRREVVALRDKFPGDKVPGDTKDVDWLPKLIAEGDWVVITQDLPKGEHEARLWLESGLTVFFLEKGWKTIELWEKASKLVKWWPKFYATAEGIAPGQQYAVPVKSPVLRPLPK